MRVLRLSRLDGRSPRSHTSSSAAKCSSCRLPGGGQLFTAPAVWRHGGHTTVFVGDENATAAYVLRRGRLYQAWENSTPGTSPVLAGGLLYVYDPAGGGIYVYRPSSPQADRQAGGRARDTGTARSSSTGTWSSPRATPMTTRPRVRSSSSRSAERSSAQA